jgi:hypothetical protein
MKKYILFLVVLIAYSCKKNYEDSSKLDYKKNYVNSLFLSLSPKMSDSEFNKYSEQEVKKNRLKKVVIHISI